MIAKEARDDWEDVLERIHSARTELQCSVSNAWFRGHPCKEFRLIPSRVRHYASQALDTHEEPSLKSARQSPADEENKLEQEIFRLLKKAYWLKLNLADDHRKQLSILVKRTSDCKKRLRNLSEGVGKLKFLEAEIRRVSAGSPAEEFKYDLPELLSKYRLRHVPGGSVESILKSIDPAAIRAAYNPLEARMLPLRNSLAQAVQELEHATALTYAEQDAFTDFNFRWGSANGTSWELLARMQHYHVETRLLDWTESLAIAFSFALRQYMDWYQDETRTRLRKNDVLRDTAPGLPIEEFIEHCEKETKTFSEPAIFVLNPYFLVRLSTGENKIKDMTLEKNFDYYECFFIRRRWPFSYPLPIYSPWRDGRLASQHAMFTVHGTDLRPLEQQENTTHVYRKVAMSRKAAAFGARQLMSLFPLDRFSLFRDLDTLGKSVQDRYPSVKRAAQGAG